MINQAIQGINIGGITTKNPVFLAPMSGVSDLPFRRLADQHGAGLVVSEMIASAELANERPDAILRANNDGASPFVIQLVGNDPKWMSEGARRAQAIGADIIDINMGCPAKEVTGKLSGSALMREPKLAISLIESVVGAVDIPVTLKMRLGWDHTSKNAPELARQAEAAGVSLITVHGRTRCQFFKGTADWSGVRPVKEATGLPIIVNGDIGTVAESRSALKLSGADGVMIGRGAYGAPWQPGRIAQALATSHDPGPPPLNERMAIAITHVETMLSHYGIAKGLRNARKHIAWYLAGCTNNQAVLKHWRRRLCTEDTPASVLDGLREFFALAGQVTGSDAIQTTGQTTGQTAGSRSEKIA